MPEQMVEGITPPAPLPASQEPLGGTVTYMRLLLRLAAKESEVCYNKPVTYLLPKE